MSNGQSQTGTFTSDQIAERIKKMYPKLAKFDNQELVSRAIKEKPKLGKLLSTDELLSLTRRKAGEAETPEWYGFTPSHMLSEGGKALQGGWQFFTDLIDVRKPIMGKTGLLHKYILDPQDQEIAKARDALHQHRYSEMFGHALASDIPLFGPMAASLGEQAGKGDIGGATAQVATAYLTGKMGGKLAESSKALPEIYQRLPGVITKTRRMALEDAYVNAKGYRVAQDFTKASEAVSKEVGKHVSAVAAHADASGWRVNANDVVVKLSREFQDVIKTPDKYPPSFVDMARDIATHMQNPRLWEFDIAKQFRSKVGAAEYAASGPMKAVLAKAYKTLSEKLDFVARQQGPAVYNSWLKYNELEKKFSQQFKDLSEDIKSESGTKNVASKLLNDKALSREAIANLKKYGLNAEDALQYMKDAERITKTRTAFGKTIFRLVYGSPAGAAAMIGARVLGANWIGAMGAAVPIALVSTYLTTLGRALKLDPEIIRAVERERAMPGPSAAPPPPSATSPTGGRGPGGPSPAGTPTGQGLPQAPPSLGPAPGGQPTVSPPAALPGVQSAASSFGTGMTTAEKISDIESLLRRETDPVDRAWLEKRRQKLLSSSVTGRVPEGESARTGPRGGVGKAGRRTANRERQARVRDEAMRTRQREAQEFEAHQISRKIPFQLDVPTMEESLREVDPDAASGLAKMRKTKKISDEEYAEYLKFYLMNHYQ